MVRTKKRQKTNGTAITNENKSYKEFRIGSIMRITLHNFLTYSDIDVYPGPRLNMVLGPNGSGKSSIVCAICLGLAGSMSSVARADNIGSYVKKGEQSGWVEIELYKATEDAKRSVVIRRSITLLNQRSIFSMNKRRVTPKVVKELCTRLNIQVDNLCAFLAQERVVEFAKMKPTELLMEAEKACDYRLFLLHQDLIKLRKNEKEFGIHCDTSKEMLEQVQEQFKDIKQDVEREENRKNMLRKIELLKRKRPWSEFGIEKDRQKDIEKDLTTLRKKMKEERAKHQPLVNDYKRWKSRLKKIEMELFKIKKQFEKLDSSRRGIGDQLERHEEDVADLNDQFTRIEDEEKEKQQRIQKAHETIQKNINLLNTLPDMPEISAEMDNIKRCIQDLRTSKHALSRDISELQQQERECNRLKLRREKFLKELRDVKRKRLELGGRDAVMLYNWVLENQRRFTSKVFGPIFFEVSVHDDVHAAFVENFLGSLKFAYVVQNKADFKLLSDSIDSLQNQRMIKYGITIICVEHIQDFNKIRRIGNPQRVKSFGGYLDGVIFCHDVVRQALFNSTGIYNVVYANEGVNHEDVMTKRYGDGGITKLFTRDLKIIQASYSSYGNHAKSTSLRQIQHAKLFAPLDETEQQSVIQEIENYRQKQDQMQQKN